VSLCAGAGVNSPQGVGATDGWRFALALPISRVLTQTAHKGVKQLSKIVPCHCPVCDEMTFRALGQQEIKK